MPKETRKVVRMKKDAFFSRMRREYVGISYDDVLLVPNNSDVMPGEADLRSRFSRNVTVKNPFVSSPMDTVTEYEMAIEMAMHGMIGIVHKALTPKEQAYNVARTKYHLNRYVDSPIFFNPEDTVKYVLNAIEEKNFNFRTFPVLDDNGKIVGLLTSNDFDFCLDTRAKVKDIMSTDLATAKEGTSMRDAFKIMKERRKKVLPIVKRGKKLVGMYLFSDAKRIITRSAGQYNLDKDGRLMVGAAVGVGDDALERAELLAKKGVDVLVIDTAHGDSRNVIATLKELKKFYPYIDVVVGNISTGEAAKRLVNAGADGIRVGQGPGSICSTRVISGSGRAQGRAIDDVERGIRGSGVPINADGGIKLSGDTVKALAAGADTVMLGGMLSGTKEAPGEIIMINGTPHKMYRGMGSIGAMQDSAEARKRYKQEDIEEKKLVPEGVEGAVPYKGDVANILVQLIGGLRSGMGYNGAKDIEDLHKKARFELLPPGAQRESHPHSLEIIKEAPNYKRMK